MLAVSRVTFSGHAGYMGAVYGGGDLTFCWFFY